MTVVQDFEENLRNAEEHYLDVFRRLGEDLQALDQNINEAHKAQIHSRRQKN